MKLRFMKEAKVDGTFRFYTERRFFLFFWIYVDGSVRYEHDFAYQIYLNLLNSQVISKPEVLCAN